ncbi:uncharacterized protein TRAVEDRAFT_30486 [Trametes versicolor FP-101664 SS1]|uniref:uncharacterized protein n=1 Tax=Trametes versicolor (strain FP-101664) TaxID=717944 RepID=UPI0004621F89|nr:uncharacterized protein TRAVEDRAFT_30486 [Trametes versicolor FP-101664 SS1]EIW55756.1 hypothetical protein TRAVEDRAFT_30486 [Trametes versicolor FP-101664 SS1]
MHTSVSHNSGELDAQCATVARRRRAQQLLRRDRRRLAMRSGALQNDISRLPLPLEHVARGGPSELRRKCKCAPTLRAYGKESFGFRNRTPEPRGISLVCFGGATLGRSCS